MKKILSTLLAFVMLATTIFAVPFSAQAEVKYPEASGTLSSGQTFTYDSITETLTISGEGEITQYDYSGSGASPFANCTIKHIVIGEGITKAYNYLFESVLGIETVSLPASLNEIYYRCFDRCEFIGSGFTVAEGNESFCADNGTLYNKDKTRLIKFVNNGLTEFTVPKTVSSIAFEAFYSDVTLDTLVLNGTNLALADYAIRGAKIEHLEINEGVKSLGDFSSIDSTAWTDETITLPASLTDIGTQSLFSNEKPIKNFVVAGGNTVFSAIDGVLYKDGTTLFSYPGGRTDTSYTVPDNTTTIGYRAFTECNNLESVDFPASVKNFSGRCLCYCSKLTTVNIRALDAEFLATDCFFGMNSSVVYNVYENSVTHKNLLDYGIAESKIAFLPLCAEHSWQFTKTVEPTCYAKGYDLYTCTICNTTENRNETNTVDHDVVTTYNEDKTIEHHLCKYHGFVIEETENLPESEHDYKSNTDAYYELSYPGADTISITFDEQFTTEQKWDYLGAYDKDGYEIAKYEGSSPAGQTYTLNGDYVKLHFHSDSSNNFYGFKITKVVAEKVGCYYSEPDTPHTHNYEYVSDGNATCTENGTETGTCACGETTNRTEENSALGHNVPTYTSNDDATCTEDGTKTGTCTVCGNPVTVPDEGSKLGHDLVEVAEAVNPTCFSVGWTAGYECSRCEYEQRQEELAKIAHTYDDSSYVSNNDATCTEDGTKKGTCTVCGATETFADEGSALGHSYAPTVVPANCTTQGYTTYTCSVCGDSYNADYTDALGHSFGENNATCAVCGIANPNYVAPSQPTTQAPTTTQPTTQAQQTTQAPTTTTTATAQATTANPKATSIKKLTKGKKSFKATWKKITGVNGYQIQYSTDKKFKKNTKTVTIKKNTASTTVKKLKDNKKYYVRVRSYKNVKVGGKTVKVYSSWSKVKTVTTKK